MPGKSTPCCQRKHLSLERIRQAIRPSLPRNVSKRTLLGIGVRRTQEPLKKGAYVALKTPHTLGADPP